MSITITYTQSNGARVLPTVISLSSMMPQITVCLTPQCLLTELQPPKSHWELPTTMKKPPGVSSNHPKAPRNN